MCDSHNMDLKNNFYIPYMTQTQSVLVYKKMNPLLLPASKSN